MRLRIRPYLTCVVLLLLSCVANTARKSGGTLTSTGSDRMVHTIFTNPGEDASTMMNISFATPPDVEATVVVDGGGEILTFPSRGELCLTYDSIYGRLRNNTNVLERHVFDKHDVVMSGLKPDTEYEYRVEVDSAGTTVKSDVRYFRTAGAPQWKAAVIGDFHHYSPLPSRLDTAMEFLETLYDVSGGFDWVLSQGDILATGGSYNSWTELSERPQFKDFMWAVSQGNHDHETLSHEKSDSFFRDSQAYPFNGYKGQEGITYWFKYGDVLFFVLNNEALRGRESLQTLFAWMEEVVKKEPTKYIVVVQHHQWIIGTDGTNSQMDRYRDFFDRIGVDLAISGHNHVYLRTYPLRDRKPVDPSQGTVYVVNSSSDNSRGRDIKGLRANTDVIAKRWSEGSHTIGGMVMDVNTERIQMTLYNRRGEVQDTFSVPAKR